MTRAKKQQDLSNHMLPSELAAYLGTTTRTIRRWMHVESFPKPSVRNEKGHKMWTPSEAKEALEWVLKRRP